MSAGQSVRRFAARGLQTVMRLVPSAVILAYHRVAVPEVDPQLLCVTPNHFADHLRVVQQLGVCISLRELVQRCAVGQAPRRGVVITFDDGYLDNLEVAEPLLRGAGLPATVFVATGGLEARVPFWWDELEMLLLAAERLPSSLFVEAQGKRLRWDMQAQADGAQLDARWNITHPGDPTARHAAYRSIAQLCRAMTVDERDGVIGQLRQQIGDRASSRQNRRLAPEQIAELAHSGTVDVGSHGVTHVRYRLLTAGECRRELQVSRSYLTKLTGKPVDLVSYPFGARDDLSGETAQLARDSGFMAACANWPGAVRWRTDPYQLPRYLVRDWSARTFGEKLEGWLRGVDVELSRSQSLEA